MADTIRLSYQEMRAVAADVSHQAERARGVIKALEQDVKRLLPTWAGASQEAFQSAYTLCRKDLARVPEMLDQVSTALRQTADLIEQAEQQSAGEMPSVITADNQ